MSGRKAKLPAEVRVDAPECGPLPPLWKWKEALDTFAVHDRILGRGGTFGVQNTNEIDSAMLAFQRRTGTYNNLAMPLPPEVPPPRLILPERGFSPDFFTSGPWRFASRRLREVLAQPPEVVEFAPIEILAGGEAVGAQDYRLMRVRAEQPAMDLNVSDCQVEEWTNWATGEPLCRAGWTNNVVFHENLQPRTELFRMEERPTVILAADALALRVLGAGITDVEFDDLGVMRKGKYVERLRTTTGLALRRVGFLD